MSASSFSFNCVALVVSSNPFDDLPFPVPVSYRLISGLPVVPPYLFYAVYFVGSDFDALCVFFAELLIVFSFEVLSPDLASLSG